MVWATSLALVQKVVVAIDLTAVIPGLPDQLRLPSIFLGPRTQWALLPGIETTGLDVKAPTYRAKPELVTILGHWDQFALQLADLRILAGIARQHLRQLQFSRIQRMPTDAEPLRYLRYQIPRSVMWATASRLNSSLKLAFPIVVFCPQKGDMTTSGCNLFKPKNCPNRRGVRSPLSRFRRS